MARGGATVHTIAVLGGGRHRCIRCSRPLSTGLAESSRSRLVHDSTVQVLWCRPDVDQPNGSVGSNYLAQRQLGCDYDGNVRSRPSRSNNHTVQHRKMSWRGLKEPAFLKPEKGGLSRRVVKCALMWIDRGGSRSAAVRESSNLIFG
jgi:hypothetical protein